MLAPVAATVGGFVGLSLLAKSQTGQRLKFGLQSKLEINQRLDLVFIGNDKIQFAFRSNLNRKHGGVHVVYSPPSTGKTTYLTQEAQRKDKLKSHNIIYLSGGIKNRADLHKALNIEPYWLRLSTVFLPVTLMGMSMGRAKTVLILDHQDCVQDFDDDQKSLFMVLATDSMLFNNYHTIVVVSDLERAEKMVKLNGGSKFYKLGKATMFKWQQEHIQEFVERSEVLMQLPVETREEIIKLGIQAGTCGFMKDVCAYFLHEGKGSTVVPSCLHRRAKELGKMWVEAARRSLLQLQPSAPSEAQTSIPGTISIFIKIYSTPVAMSEDTLLREVTSEGMELFNKLQVYLSVICPAMLFDGVAPPGAFENALGTQECTEALMRFVSTSESSVLLIEKSDSSSVKIGTDVKMPVSANITAYLAVIKAREAPLDNKYTLCNQVQVISMTIDRESESQQDEVNQSFFTRLHQFTRHFYAPLARSARQNTQSTDGTVEEDESIKELQKKIRELDFALEQCQRGTSIPNIVLSTSPALLAASKLTTPVAVRNYLDRYNPSLVDQLFKDVHLTQSMGETEAQREEFAMEVNNASKLWPQDIARQTRLLGTPFAGSVEKEINFWKDLDRKLADTKEQLEGAPVLLTKLVLKRTNRVSESLIHEAEATLDASIKTVEVSLAFLRDFPIEGLLSATSLSPDLTKATVNGLLHFAKLKHSQYDFARAVRLLEVLGNMVLARMVTILRENNVMQCSMEKLRAIRRDCDELYSKWGENHTLTRKTLAEVGKRRNEKPVAIPQRVDFDALQQRLHLILKFREQHEKLLNILSVVLVGSDGDFIVELNEGFQMVLRASTDVLDTTSSGNATWASSMQLYEKKLEKVEDHVTRILEERLSKAKSADEMFRIFSAFNPLFFRPTIRNAVNSFRATLVKNVREDVKRLQDKFRLRYDESQERVTAELRDIPPLSGRIIWARQIENQLSTLMARMRDVLGVGWEEHLEGKQLKQVCDELRNYLVTNQIYDDWLQKQLKADTRKSKTVKDFLLLVEEDPRTAQKFLKINFDESQVVVFKEVKYLEWLLPSMAVAHKAIPSTIKSRSAETYARYPVALALQSVLSSFHQANAKINNDNVILLTAHVQAVREAINEAIGGSKRSKWIKWDSPDTNEWVTYLSTRVYELQERVDDVTEKVAQVNQLVESLQTCAYSAEEFLTIIGDIQVIVDELPMRGLSNIPAWATLLDKRIEAIVRSRLQNAIALWVEAFLADNTAARESKRSARKAAEDSKVLRLAPMVHEILLSNQILSVSPPLEQARIHWIQQLHEWVAVALTLPRIVTSRYQVFAEADSSPKNFADILKTISAEVLQQPYLVIEEKIAQAKEYVVQWLQYQALWDASSAVVAERLDRDIPKWQQLLTEIKLARMSVDSTQEEKLFGPIVVNHRQVQSKINVKYDAWQKESQSKFGAIILEEIKTTHAHLIATKTRLESIVLEGPTKDVIVGVEAILKVKSSIELLNATVNDLKSSEKLLQTQRFQFPADWVPVTNVLSTFSDMHQILDRRVAAMDLQLPALQLKIREEDASVSARREKFMDNWSVQKPVEGHLNPAEVLQSLSMFGGQLVKLAEDSARVNGAKEALNMDFLSDDRIVFIETEIADLKEAWAAVLPVHEKLHALRAVPMKDLVALKIRKQLEDISGEVRTLPAKVRSYASAEFLLDQISKYQSYQVVLKELCTEALKERHWKVMLKKMEINTPLSALTVGDVWECNPLVHRKSIQEVLSTAQGEQALEQFLRDLREFWVTCEVNMTTRDGVKIVIGWDVLFTALEDNLNSLVSLKQSPYFRNVHEFQEDTTSWESRLTHLRGIFEVWVEVQRKWLYLRGIFKNADIKAQLPAQFTKFKSIDSEYLNITKRVASKPTVLDLLQLDNLQRQLERQDATMALIQKALGDYLEKQRQIFPRFYFINNDDLVEIIGNSNEPSKIVVHLNNMFAAISGVEMTDSTKAAPGSALAVSIASKEGEVVPLITAVDVTAGVKDWLASLESQMAITLASLLQEAISASPSENSKLLQWVDKYPAQVVILTSQLVWSQNCEKSLSVEGATKVHEAQSTGLQLLESKLHSLSECVLQDMESALRKKCEQLLTEMVHQRDVLRQLIADKVASSNDFGWLYHLRFYWNPTEKNLMQRLCIRMSNASFFYGFEYLGIGERLVQTPLTDRCYLTLTQALHFRMGANPFGPAGTGKTESVKMLGSQLGRFVLVFNCDSSFDYAAMGRIFSGLCQVGAWGCFDEFNRLEERILSAVSQQILTIQKGLLAHQTQIELLGNPCKLSKDVGIFVTMNPGYAGRSNLPDNLKQLFRAVAMSVPDRKLIAQVMLFSQGIVTAEELAGKIVLLFTLCEEQLSVQSHYDFGLRALKSVLVGAGELKRQAILNRASAASAQGEMKDIEMKVLIKATCDSVLPKLVADDIYLFTSLLQAVFPGSELPSANESALLEALQAVCAEDNLEFGEAWGEKILQLKQVLDIRHGVMMVGPSGTGKTTAYRTLLKALGKVDGIKGDFYVIDPKSIKKEKLYGTLDPNTLEWTDGVFTKILRKVSDSSAIRGVRRSWIVFDGDVDPEWAENLNSVLDDNKVLTLPSGDRLKIPNNVRIMMEVDTLKHATLATVSRCGMVWFPEGTVSVDILLNQQLAILRKSGGQAAPNAEADADAPAVQTVQCAFAEVLAPYFTSTGLVGVALQFAQSQTHVMEASTGRLLSTLNCMLTRGLALVLEHNDNNVDFPMTDSHMQLFVSKWLMFSLLWSFGGSMTTDKRLLLCDLLTDHSNVDMPISGTKLIDLHANVSDGSWVEWNTMVPKMEIESHKVSSADVVITTTDTVRHIEVMKAWLSSHKPLILCGPPGSGKTMTLTSVLESMPEYILASLNFSSGTTPDLILKTFAQFCEVVDSPDGLIMQPNRQSYGENQWLVVFCDEINLPAQDLYGTQRVIMFLRQLTEQGGYWTNDCKWIHLRRIQFVGACNPPTDAGRVGLSSRFLRLAPILLVDYPAEQSLKQIYRCFNQALLKLHPNLKGMLDPLNNAMVYFYLRNQEKFTPDVAPQYIYSPRELSRWVRALYEAVEPLDAMTADELVRLWAHEALRLFQDRLISVEEKDWCEALVDEVAAKFFPGLDLAVTLARPILYSNWLKKTYQSTDREVLRDFVGARLKVFYEEELDVPLVIFDEVLDHVLRIDNVLRHPMGHLLLVGESGVGKTVLTRFVSWMNGLTVFQIKANSKYTIEQFDEDLRGLFRRVGVEGEKICFIFDESNALSSAFLERMNALLASGEVPGLFEGEERVQLMAACREAFSQREGVMLDSEDELSRRFTRIIQRNLHVVFTMNPASSDFDNRCTTSPALFNRCVVDWFGTWSSNALAQVAHAFTQQLDTGYTDYKLPGKNPQELELVMSLTGQELPTLSEAVVASLICVHNSVKTVAAKLRKATGRQHYLSPRDFLDLINKFVATESEKRNSLEDQQTHIRTGLLKLSETQEQVTELNKEMVAKSAILRTKDAEANEKLTQMVEKQNEAENRKAIAEKLTVELTTQNEQIRVRRETVEAELSVAEPALLAAKQSVQSIKKTHLDEVRSLAKPPKNVQLTMEMVSAMLGEASSDWNDIRKVIRKEDFISTVVNFDPLSLTAKQIKMVEDNYLSTEGFDYNSVDRASKACGPLYSWASSQILYATVLRKIKPLREEVDALQTQSSALTIQQQEAVEQVAELEAAIKCYKSEYAAAIRDTETIRAEMDVVTKRVSRAQALLSSLEQERVRWTATSVSFDEQMSTLVGDNLLAAGFLTYAGTFDYKVRRSLLLDWTETLDSMGIPYRPELDFISYLCRPSDQVQWRGFGLPSDDLATQNAILLERFNRYPLVIDPSGQATSFILAKYAAQKMVQTSFLDASFMKTLASAIRFGTPLLVQDVESLDPVLNPVLNKELQKTGGRTLIRLGSEDIDFSPKFLIILLTRNPLAKFAPDLCSRVTMVNFTVTPSSLESQALSAVLKAERPDVDKRRTDVLRLQGEQSAKMRDLQDALLSQISAVQGAILDDDRVINTLETIKAEAAELNKEAAKTGEILEEVKSVSNTYTALASAMASVYFSLEGLSEVSFLYQYSLQFFLDIIESVLANATKISANVGNASTSEKVAKQRLKTLTVTFYNEVSRRVLRGLRHEDQLMFLVRLAQIATRGQTALGLEENEMDFLLKGAVPLVLESGSSTAQKFKDSLPGDVLSDSMARQLMALSFLPSFSGLLSSLTSSSEQWIALLHATEPEKLVPMEAITGHEKLSSERAALLRVLVVKALRPERLSETLEEYITTVFAQEGFDWRDHSALNLRQIVEADSRASTPLMLCSESGQDASGKVDALSSALGKTLLQVAMGSAEGFTEADKLIAQAAKTGSWVLLRNVHLCTDWLSLLEKKLHGFSAHANFRLFLTCNIHPRLPSALLRASEVVVFEASTGIKANIQRFYSSVPAARIERAPAERGRLYGLLAWFNAVVHERLRYTPLGWTKHYEFTEADTACSIDVIDQWVDLVAGTRAHVDPVDLPWQALRVLLSQSLFGGRVDHQFDQAALDSFIESVFNAQNYAAGAVLARDHKGQALVTLPDALGRQAFEAWVKTLPDSNSPSWIGLPVTAESQLKSQAARRVLANLALLQGGQETDYAGALEQQGQQQQLELNNTAKLVNPWIAALPTEDQLPVVSPDSLSSAASLPAERWLAREIIRGSAVVKLVRDDLLSISAYCKGEIKATNNLRELLSSLRKSTVPARWRSQYAVRTTVTLGEWVADLVQRARALTTKYTAGLQNSAELMKCSFWVGGMFTPEAFVTATRQQTAQLNKWSLEDVELVLHFESDSSHSSCDARIEGAMLEGAQWSTASQSIELSEELHCPLPACYLRWSLKSQRTTELNSGTRRVAFPLYLTSQRATLVSEVLVAVPTALPASVWAQRGVAVIFQSSA